MWPLGAGFCVVGLVLTVIGGVSAWRHVRRRRTWTPGRATVVGYRWSGVGDRSVQHWNMERTTDDGHTVRATTRLGTSWGTIRSFPFDIDVLVNPADEEQFVPASGCRSGVSGFLMLVGGIVLLAFGVLVLNVILGSGRVWP